jgi:hypothetical protein
MSKHWIKLDRIETTYMANNRRPANCQIPALMYIFDTRDQKVLTHENREYTDTVVWVPVKVEHKLGNDLIELQVVRLIGSEKKPDKGMSKQDVYWLDLLEKIRKREPVEDN